MALDPQIRAQFDEYLNDPIALPDAWKAWLVRYIEVSGLTLPITSSIGAANAFATATPSGVILQYAGTAAPSGWVLCDGTTYDGSNTTYQPLYNVINITYGGSGTSFKVPDLRGRVPVGLSSAGPAAVNTLGNGDAVAVNNRNISHTHTAHTQGAGTTGVVVMPVQGVGGTNDVILTLIGGDGNNLNSPAYLVLNYIIKL